MTLRPADTPRVCALPVWRHSHADGVSAGLHWSGALARGIGAPPLRPIQGLALSIASRMDPPVGLFVAAGVGHGKTLVSFLVSEVWHAKAPLIIVPASLIGQTKAALHTWSRWYRFPRPRVLSYQSLSQPDASDLLERLAPDVIVMDEAQAIARHDASRTKRVLRYAEAHPHVRFVVLSGSFTSIGVCDYAHLAELALRDGSFLPLADHALELWASVLDTGAEPGPDAYHAMGALRDLFPCPSLDTQAELRRAFALRMHTTPGVVATTDSAVDIPLHITRVRRQTPPAVESALAALSSKWELPDGTQLVDALSFVRASRQLSVGFYYVFDWPDGVVDTEWLDARREWAAVIRTVLRNHAAENFDSPALVTRAVQRGEGTRGQLAAWAAWAAVKNRPEPPTRAVWLDLTILDETLREIDASPGPALIWYASQALGDRLGALGLTVHGAASGVPDSRARFPCVSIAVHREGRNLQAWSRNIILEPMASCARWEQLLGRTHRPGQTATVVTARVLTDPWPFKQAIETALAKSRYIQETTLAKQKLLTATWQDG